MKHRYLSIALSGLFGCSNNNLEPTNISFMDVTEATGITSTATWKYGGPTLADLNNDGRYDLVLSNHHEMPAQLFYSSENHRFTESDPILTGDVHGIAAGDFDQDGLVDLIVSVGGGNGTMPSPPRLLRNIGSSFTDVTEAAGIATLGARGRSVRWVDLDTDGDLDLLEIVAQQLITETGPRNILFENVGAGNFKYRESPNFEGIEAERVLISDIDNDHVPDLVTFTPLRIMKGDNAFGFIDVTSQWLPELDDADLEHAMAVSEADIDNDGDMDLYVARGKTHYEIANNSIELDESGRMNLRDEGSASQDSIEFSAGNTVGLLDFWHWPRGVDLKLPVYLGANKVALQTPTSEIMVDANAADGFPATFDHNGWYLGHLGDGRWKLAWNLSDDLAWGLRASVTGVLEVYPSWTPQKLGVPDLLLINEGDHFRNASAQLPTESGDNNWGVVTGDFDNDTDADFFVWRFGQLHGRVADILLTNNEGVFLASDKHGANNIDAGGHGDMGAPLDYDEDGWLDLLSGSDNSGYWNLYRNTTASKNRSLTIRVGNAQSGTDPHGAEVYLKSPGGQQYKRVGSAGAVHSQGLNNLVHFGLGVDDQASVRVRWRDGSEIEITGLTAGQVYQAGAPSKRFTGAN